MDFRPKKIGSGILVGYLLFCLEIVALSMLRPEDHVHRQQFQTASFVHSRHLQKAADIKRTSCIDLLYGHWWDFAPSIEEAMNVLHGYV